MLTICQLLTFMDYFDSIDMLLWYPKEIHNFFSKANRCPLKNKNIHDGETTDSDGIYMSMTFSKYKYLVN